MRIAKLEKDLCSINALTYSQFFERTLLDKNGPVQKALFHPPDSISFVNQELHSNFKEIADRAATCFKIAEMKRNLVQNVPTTGELIEKELDSARKEAISVDLERAKNQGILEYSVDAIMFALQVYALAADHHFYLKFKMTETSR